MTGNFFTDSLAPWMALAIISAIVVVVYGATLILAGRVQHSIPAVPWALLGMLLAMAIAGLVLFPW